MSVTASMGRPEGWDAARRGRGACLMPDALFDGREVRVGACLRIVGSRTTLCDRPDAGPVWTLPGILSPGFVDLQVNGGGGVLFNACPTASGARAIARAHRTTGTTSILPTLISDAADVMEKAVVAILQAHGTEGIIGIHLEGPHISVARRGTHARQHVRPLDAATLGLVARLRGDGIPVMLTVAPEACAPGQISALVRQGVVVAIGHTDATAERVRQALGEGAQTFTHLFNAMSQMQNREPGVVGAAINSQAFCSFICDTIHVAPEMLQLAIRARPVPDRMILVSDAMPTVAGPDHFDLYGQNIGLHDGRLLNAEGNLAGAHVTMLQSVRNTIDLLGRTPAEALRMAITNPARLMGRADLSDITRIPVQDMILIAPDFSSCGFPVLDQE